MSNVHCPSFRIWGRSVCPGIFRMQKFQEKWSHDLPNLPKQLLLWEFFVPVGFHMAPRITDRLWSSQFQPCCLFPSHMVQFLGSKMCCGGGECLGLMTKWWYIYGMQCYSYYSVMFQCNAHIWICACICHCKNCVHFNRNVMVYVWYDVVWHGMYVCMHALIFATRYAFCACCPMFCSWIC